MQMTDEQVWTDLERFAAAMKRGAVVVMTSGRRFGAISEDERELFDRVTVQQHGGIREIIEPPQKKVRPLNAEEWKSVRGLVVIGSEHLVPVHSPMAANRYADTKAMGHPAGFPNDVRKLWVEE